MYPTNNNIVLKEIIEGDSPLALPESNTPVLYDPTAAAKLLRRYEIVDITSNVSLSDSTNKVRVSNTFSIAGDIVEIGDYVAVRAKDVEDFFDGLVFTEVDNVVAISKRGK